MAWMLVALGGALGAVSRYALTGWVQTLTGGTFPWGTMTVNVLGSLLLGFAMAWLQTAALSADVRRFAAIGLLGSFTTFSTFSYEAAALLRDGEWGAAGGYVLGSLGAGLLAVGVGYALATSLVLTGSRG